MLKPCNICLFPVEDVFSLGHLVTYFVYVETIYCIKQIIETSKHDVPHLNEVNSMHQFVIVGCRLLMLVPTCQTKFVPLCMTNTKEITVRHLFNKH